MTWHPFLIKAALMRVIMAALFLSRDKKSSFFPENSVSSVKLMSGCKFVTLGESSQYTGQDEMTGEPETEVFVVEASTESLPAIGRQTDQVGVPDVWREGPYDVYDVPS